MADSTTAAATIVATVEAITPHENSILTTADQTSSSNDNIPKILKDEAKPTEEVKTKPTEEEKTKPTEAETKTKVTVEETKEPIETETKTKVTEEEKTKPTEAETKTKEIKEPTPVTTDTTTAESTKPSEPEPEPKPKPTTEATTTTTGEEQNLPAKDTVNVINTEDKTLPDTPVGEEVKETKVDGDGESSDRGTSNGKKNNRKSILVRVKNFFGGGNKKPS